MFQTAVAGNRLSFRRLGNTVCSTGAVLMKDASYALSENQNRKVQTERNWLSK